MTTSWVGAVGAPRVVRKNSATVSNFLCGSIAVLQEDAVSEITVVYHVGFRLRAAYVLTVNWSGKEGIRPGRSSWALYDYKLRPPDTALWVAVIGRVN